MRTHAALTLPSHAALTPPSRPIWSFLVPWYHPSNLTHHHHPGTGHRPLRLYRPIGYKVTSWAPSRSAVRPSSPHASSLLRPPQPRWPPPMQHPPPISHPHHLHHHLPILPADNATRRLPHRLYLLPPQPSNQMAHADGTCRWHMQTAHVDGTCRWHMQMAHADGACRRHM